MDEDTLEVSISTDDRFTDGNYLIEIVGEVGNVEKRESFDLTVLDNCFDAVIELSEVSSINYIIGTSYEILVDEFKDGLGGRCGGFTYHMDVPTILDTIVHFDPVLRSISIETSDTTLLLEVH